MATEAVIFQQIVDMNWDQAIYTASPNNTINVAQFAAKGSGTNIAVALTPKGTGYISAQVPDGTVAGGNARGAKAVDLQSVRQNASQIASGDYSCVPGGFGSTASGQNSMAWGDRNTASGIYSVSGGLFSSATGRSSVAIGEGTNSNGNGSVAMCNGGSATANGSVAIGTSCVSSGLNAFCSGNRGAAYLSEMRSHGGYSIAVAGSTQEICLPLGGKTTTNAEVVLTLGNAIKPILNSNRIWTGILHITGSKSDGSAIARYHRQLTISRVVNDTSLVGSVITIGTDEAAGTSINITASDTDEALSVGVTGVTSETWRWVAVFHGAELAIGA